MNLPTIIWTLLLKTFVGLGTVYVVALNENQILPSSKGYTPSRPGSCTTSKLKLKVNCQIKFLLEKLTNLIDTNPIFFPLTIHFQQLQFICTYMIWLLLLLLLQTANDIRQLAFKGQKASTIIYNHKRPFRREPDH